MGTKVNSNYEDLLTFTRASKGHALRPVSYGTELVTNGTFDDNIDSWTDNNPEGTIAYNSSGAMDLARNGGNGAGIAVQTIGTISVGKLYKVSFDVTAVNGAVRIRFDNQSFTTEPNNTTGHFSFSFVATTSSDDFIIDLRNAINGTATIDNVSVKEVLFDQPDGTLTLFEHPDNVPRVEYDADGNRLGLLVEESRTNLITHSENFSNSSWNSNKQGISVSIDVAVAPDGTLTADKLNETATTDTHRVGFNISSVGDAVFSFFAKAGERTFVRTWAFVGGNTAGAEFNLSTGAIVREHTSGAATIKNVGNGWYRCSCTVDAASANSVVVGPVTEAVSGNANYAGEAGKGIYIWGAQLEEASFPTSYIKTTGSTATRSADVAKIPVADFGYNTAVGSVVVTGRSYEPGTDNYFFEMSKDSPNRNFAKCADSQHLIVTFGGVIQANLGAGAIAANTEAKLAVSIQTDNFGASLDGGAVVTDTSGTAELNVSEFRIGSNRTGGEILNGHIKSIKYYPRRLTNAQLQDITS